MTTPMIFGCAARDVRRLYLDTMPPGALQAAASQFRPAALDLEGSSGAVAAALLPADATARRVGCRAGAGLHRHRPARGLGYHPGSSIRDLRRARDWRFPLGAGAPLRGGGRNRGVRTGRGPLVVPITASDADSASWWRLEISPETDDWLAPLVTG